MYPSFVLGARAVADTIFYLLFLIFSTRLLCGVSVTSASFIAPQSRAQVRRWWEVCDANGKNVAKWSRIDRLTIYIASQSPRTQYPVPNAEFNFARARKVSFRSSFFVGSSMQSTAFTSKAIHRLQRPSHNFQYRKIILSQRKEK